MTPIDRRLLKMPSAMRRKLLMHSYARAARAPRKAKREMQAETEIHIATAEDGVTRILSAQPRPCGVCGFPRTMFVCRHGRTRCYECDEGFSKAETAIALGIGARA